MTTTEPSCGTHDRDAGEFKITKQFSKHSEVFFGRQGCLSEGIGRKVPIQEGTTTDLFESNYIEACPCNKTFDCRL